MKNKMAKIQILFFLISFIYLNMILFEIKINLFPNFNQKSKFSQPVTSNPTLWAWNYDDNNPEGHSYVYKNSTTQFQTLLVEFPIPSQNYVIVKGLRYRYRSYGLGPHDVTITYSADDFHNPSFQWVVDSVDNDIPYEDYYSTRTVYYHGPIYAIDDNPSVSISSDQLSSNCLAIGADRPNQGTSYFINNDGVFLENSYEFTVDLMYEEIPILTLDDPITGRIYANDYLDAYFVDLYERHDYRFSFERTSGTGNLNMRLVEFEPLTISKVQNNSEISDKRIMNYTPSRTGRYVLLIEPIQYNIDFAHYSLIFSGTPIIIPEDTWFSESGLIFFTIMVSIIIALVIFVSLYGGFLLWKKKRVS